VEEYANQRFVITIPLVANKPGKQQCISPSKSDQEIEAAERTQNNKKGHILY